MHRCFQTLHACVRKCLCCLIGGLFLPLSLLPPGHGEEKQLQGEEGRLDIYVNGQKIGQEGFSIQYTAGSIRSSSTLNFRDPGNQHQKVHIETSLDMDTQYQPKSYQVQTDIEKRKVAMKGTFVPGQADFVYQVDGVARKMGLLVGDHYILLDTNVFHHFIFLARAFDFGADKTQAFDIVIPQELDRGTLKVTAAGVEEVSVRGKKMTLNHLKVDSGKLLIDLWVDSGRFLYKIALPAKGIEIIRNF